LDRGAGTNGAGLERREGRMKGKERRPHLEKREKRKREQIEPIF